jgi:hypothetical protein
MFKLFYLLVITIQSTQSISILLAQLPQFGYLKDIRQLLCVLQMSKINWMHNGQVISIDLVCVLSSKLLSGFELHFVFGSLH